MPKDTPEGHKEYVKVELEGYGSYIQPRGDMSQAIEGEIDGLFIGDTVTLHLTRLTMAEEEYKALPEFAGH